MRRCKNDEIINPKTQRCVKKSGKIGKKILAVNENIRQIKILT